MQNCNSMTCCIVMLMIQQPASQKERTFKVEIKTGKKLLLCAAGYRLVSVFISIQQLWGIPPSDTSFGSWSFSLLMVPRCLELQNVLISLVQSIGMWYELLEVFLNGVCLT